MRRMLRPTALLVTFAAVGWADAARSLVARGNRAYQRGQFDQALEAYQQAARVKPEAAEIWFNLGNALYRRGDYRAAMDAYEQAAVRSRKKALEARSKFNQGNACLRQALADGSSDPTLAVEGLRASVRLYQDALKLDASLGDARHNIEVARRLMKQFEQKHRTQAGREGDSGPPSAETPAPQNQQARAGAPRSAGAASAPPQSPRAEPQRAEPSSDPVREILEQEREYRRRRHSAASGGIRPVDKDW
jgi:Ca-activated chloride channel family protein